MTPTDTILTPNYREDIKDCIELRERRHRENLLKQAFVEICKDAENVISFPHDEVARQIKPVFMRV